MTCYPGVGEGWRIKKAVILLPNFAPPNQAKNDIDIVAEKGGVILDFRDINVLEDYRNVIQLVLEDGIISPSEDQMMWVMRQQIGVTEEQHVALVQEIFGDNALKECPNCNQMTELYPEYSAWYCQPCESWL